MAFRPENLVSHCLSPSVAFWQINEIKEILKMKEPYSKIPTVPLLIEKYNNKILSLLEEESLPVLESIKTCKKEVLETLDLYNLKDKFINDISQDFTELIYRTEKASSFSILFSMTDLAERRKIKWIMDIMSEFTRLEAERLQLERLAEEERLRKIREEEEEEESLIKDPKATSGNGGGYVVKPIILDPPITIKMKPLSMKELVKGQRTIKSEADIDAVVEDLRKRLKEELEKDTIITLV